MSHPGVQVILPLWVGGSTAFKQGLGQESKIGTLEVYLRILLPEIQPTAKSAVIIRGHGSKYCVEVRYMSLNLLKPINLSP